MHKPVMITIIIASAKVNPLRGRAKLVDPLREKKLRPGRANKEGRKEGRKEGGKIHAIPARLAHFPVPPPRTLTFVYSTKKLVAPGK